MAEVVRADLTAALVAADADLPLAAALCARGAREGSVRRVYVEKPAREELRRLLVDNLREMAPGALADENAAAAVEERLKEAVARGARLWAGGPRRGALLPPALVENAPADARLAAEDFAAPVVLLEAADSRADALERLAAFADGGRRAAIFTNDLALILRAFERLKVGALIVNDVSGADREGARPALEARRESRTLVMRA
jgi:acyl-CoA reductase-like NAD-dependent aldehyde dehydrogenase